jgi:hypothetical protein
MILPLFILANAHCLLQICAESFRAIMVVSVVGMVAVVGSILIG